MTSSRWRPRTTVAAVIERDGRYLLVRERCTDGVLRFNQPAGHLEPGESLIDAMAREVREETGWGFQAEALVAIYRSARPPLPDTFVRFTFSGQVQTDGPRGALDQGIVDTCWMTRAEIESRETQLRSHLILLSIDDFERGRRYPLDILVEA